MPVQALDHATGYLMAAAAVVGLTHRLVSGHGRDSRVSLARTAKLLIEGPKGDDDGVPLAPTVADYSPNVEHGAFGPLLRLAAPVLVDDAPMRWSRPAAALGTADAVW